MPVYKLHYFNIRVKAELARLMFAYSGVPYEDIRIPHPEWPSVQNNYPFGQIPVLEIDGKQYGESVAIFNYLAREFGLYGDNNIQHLEIDQVVGITQDIWPYILKWIYARFEPEKQKEVQKENVEKHFPRYLAFLEKILKQNGTGFYVGNKLSYADLAAFDVIDIEVPDSLLETFPLVKANREMVRTHEKLKDYIANRKDSDR